MKRRDFLAGSAACSLAAWTGQALAQSGPLTKIIFPFAAGGGGDALCRLLAQHIGPLLDRNIIVENRTGGDGLIGIKAVKGASPDGTTILVTTGPTMYLLPMVETTPSFDAAKDFVPVSQLTRFEFCVFVGTAVPAEVKDFKQFVAWLKANPDKATFGVPSNGTIPHFTGSRLEQALGIKLTRVAYRGSAPIINDLVGGHMPFAISTLTDAIPQHRAGNVRILAVGSAQRSPFLPDAPTLEGERRRSGGGRLVRHVAAGGRFVRFREETERGGRRRARQARGQGEAAGDRPDPGRLDARRPDAGTRRQHRLLAADREGDRLQDHELELPLAPQHRA